MRCSVAILNWNGRHHLQRFLSSVVENTPSDVEIVVIDNGSSDDSLEWLADNFAQVKTVVLDKNYGYAGGYNKGLEALDSDVFVLLNSDVETPRGWLEPLISVLENNAKVAAVAPKILSLEEKDRFEYAGAAGGYIDVLGYPFCRGRIMEAVEYDKGQYDDEREVFWASGACMVVRADIFKALGGFDADFFAHMEEIDLCWRMQKSGYKIMTQPQSKVYHLGGGTLPQNTPRKLYLNYRNNLAMLFKNHSCGLRLVVMPVRFCFDMASAVVFVFQGHSDFSKAVFRAYKDFFRSIPSLRKKRAKITSAPDSKIVGMLKGSIVIKHLIFKKLYFSQIKHF